MNLIRVDTVRLLLAEAHARFGSRPFLIRDRLLETVSYSEVLHFTRGLEERFDAMQIPAGASVAVLLDNCGLAVLLFLAVIASRRVLVPLNPKATSSEIGYMLDQSKCVAILVDPSHVKATSYIGKHVITIANHRDFLASLLDVGQHIDAGEAPPETHPEVFGGEILFTSGSTGRPKGVVLSEHNLLAEADAIASLYNFGVTDTFLTVCPLFHIAGQTITTLACAVAGGTTVAVQSELGLANFWHYVDKYRVTWSFVMTPFIAVLLSANSGPGAARTLRGLITGGSAIDGSMITRFEARFGVPVRTAYGLTETTSICTAESLDPTPRSLGSSGKPLPICEIRIESGSNQAPHRAPRSGPQLGEILVSGKNIFDSYIGNPDLTRMRKGDGWLHTSDVGYLDANGNLFIVDRVDSMLVVGGENVYPAEIENLCTALPGAAQVVLVGIDHPLLGKELVLLYRSESGVSPSMKVWHQILSREVSGNRLPHRYLPIQELGLSEFPETHVGKIDRRRLATLVTANSPTDPDILGR